jgi:hypothetical protein
MMTIAVVVKGERNEFFDLGIDFCGSSICAVFPVLFEVA